MRPLSKDLREKMVSYLAERESNSLRDYSGRDLYELARSGMRGVEENTDLELLDQYIEIQSCCCCDHPNSDPQLLALNQLLHWGDRSASEKAEIQTYITKREAEIAAIPADKMPKCDECTEMLADIDQVKREIGL
jgi:hypothetical protein